MSDLSAIWVLYRKELRSAMRERSIVVNSILLPILLYPTLLWIMLTGLTFVMGLSEDLVSRVVLVEVPASHGGIRERLGGDEGVELVAPPASVEDGIAAIRAGELDAVVEFLPAGEAGTALDDNFRTRISYDRSEARSERARQRVEGALDGYREAWLEGEAARLGIAADEIEQYRVESRNVATSEEMGAFVLGGMVPLFLVIMVALGCFIPAVDSTAGERERRTWETTMTMAASRRDIVTAKYLYVATLGMLAGSLNVVAVTVSMGPIFQPLVGDAGRAFTFTIPPSAFPVMILGAALLALFFAAAMMILAAFARTFKDGQAMVTPVYWLALLPLILGDSPDQHLTPQMAAIPVANVAMMIRDAIVGSFQPLLILETLAVGLVMVAACLWVAGQVLRFEDLVMGSYDGSFWKFARERLIGSTERRA